MTGGPDGYKDLGQESLGALKKYAAANSSD